MAQKKSRSPGEIGKSGSSSGPLDEGGVHLVQDPFGIPTLEINQAQASSEPIDENVPEIIDFDDDLIDESLAPAAQVRAEFESLAAAISSAEEQHLADARKLAQAIIDAERDSQDQLNREIAEDQALEAQEAKDSEEAENNDPAMKAALPDPLDLAEIQSAIEALLFISDKPVSLKKLHDLLGAEDYAFSALQEAATAMKDRYAAPHFGIELIEVGGGLQFRTKPIRAALSRKLSKIQIQRLSSGGMETLAIIAYKQPVLKDEIDKIRGVDSSYFIRGLLDRKLIKMTSRSELPGRPILYGTTDEFLQLFGLKDLETMPSLQELEGMLPASQSKNPEDEDPRVKILRKLVGEMNADVSVSLLYDPREDEKILTEMRERVGAIPTSTPYLDEQKAAEKAAKDAAKLAALAATEPAADLEAEGVRQRAIESAGGETVEAHSAPAVIQENPIETESLHS